MREQQTKAPINTYPHKPHRFYSLKNLQKVKKIKSHSPLIVSTLASIHSFKFFNKNRALEHRLHTIGYKALLGGSKGQYNYGAEGKTAGQ